MKAGTSFAQKNFDHSILNFGVKVGLNALSSNHYDVYYEDTKLSYGKQANKNGYLVNLFARINLDRFFMQPEIEWNLHRQECHFAIPLSLEENTYQSPRTLEVNENAFHVYVLAGYHIVRNGPYLINCYLGGAVRTNYKTDYKFNDFYSLERQNFRYNYLGVIGSSLNVGILHFDIRYHLNFPNTDINLGNISDIDENFQGMTIRKNESILSFSCGVMF